MTVAHLIILFFSHIEHKDESYPVIKTIYLLAFREGEK